MTITKKNLVFSSIVSFFILFWFSELYVDHKPLRDFDRFYHFAISKEMVQNKSLIHNLPQVADLGWGNYFPDKEFLFHIGTAIGYFLQQDAGVEFFCLLCTLLLFFVIFRFSLKYNHLHVGVILIFLLLLLNPLLMLRLTLVRPHVLAVLCFVITCYGLQNRSKFIAFLGALTYALAYHAYYMVFILVFVYYLEFIFKEGFKNKKFTPTSELLLCLLAIILGIVINPYFPANIDLSLIHLKIAFGTSELKALPFGEELIPKGFFFNLRNTIIIFPFIGLFLWKKFIRGISSPSGGLALFIFTSVCTMVFFFSPRIYEYLFPVFAMFVAYNYNYLFSETSKTLKIALLLFVVIIQTINTGIYLRENTNIDTYSHLTAFNNDTIQALEKIPLNNKVYHCNWSSGPIILYNRPDLQFIDILDPSFLYFKNRELFALRQLLNLGKIADPQKAISKIFQAKYVLCDHAPLVEQLKKMQTVKVLYQSTYGIHLFTLHE